MSHYREGPPPPPNPHTRHVVRVPKGAVLRLTILSRKLYGVWTHWNGRFTEPCSAESPDCHGCKAGQPRRWKGYLHAKHVDQPYTFLLEITPVAARELLQQAGDQNDLRGLQVRLERSRGASNGRLNATAIGRVPDSRTLEEEIDPLPTLQRLWSNEPTGQDSTLPYDRRKRA